MSARPKTARTVQESELMIEKDEDGKINIIGGTKSKLMESLIYSPLIGKR